jgi:adenylyltransferase/sulfurtransferase
LSNTPFSEQQLERYSRHILLPEIGGKGQRKIAQARVFLVGAGGLGSPTALYLAAAGVGTIGIIDNDIVDLSNLQRQILHNTATVGTPKVESAQKTISAINPDLRVVAYQEKLTAENISRLIENYDVVVDGSDNFSTRFLVNDAAYFLKKPVVSGSIFQFSGQLTVLKPAAGDYPCYRCLYPEPPPPGLVPSCQEAGVLGIIAGTIGVLQATEVLKEILGIGSSLAGRLLLYDALALSFQNVRVPKIKSCALCGPDPTIIKVVEYDEGCALPPSPLVGKEGPV